MSDALVETVKALPLKDRLQLVQEIWTTIEEEDLPPASTEEIRLAEERLVEYRANPDAIVSLDQVKARFSDKP